MLQQTNQQTRQIVIGLVIVGAILMIALIPFMSFDMVNPIVSNQIERIAQYTEDGNPAAPLLTLTTWLVSFFYPFWGTLSLVAGIVILFIAAPLYKGETWAKGLTLLCLAIPAMGGAYMIVPWMNFVGSKVGGFPPAVIIMSIGLIPYFAVVLADKSDVSQKVVDFLVFLMLGVTAAESFANGHAAYRILFGHLKRPLFADGIAITFFGWLGLWVGAAMLIAAIYVLGVRKEAGWYLTIIGGTVVAVASGATHYIRHATLDYLYGSLMGISLVVMMLIPFFKERLFKAKAE